MIADLNVATLQQKSINGITVKCADGGTKKVTIKFENKGTVKYSAHYNNCKEKDLVRDVIYEIETVDDLIVRDVEKRTANGELFDAAGANDINKVKKSLKSKADVNYSEELSTEDGGEIASWTPLMSAASLGNLAMVELLVKRGARINDVNGDIHNSLWLAAYYGKTDVVKYLIKRGGHYNAADSSGMTPLMMASVNGDIDVVELLLKQKAERNSRHKDGDTALMFAIAGKNTGIAKKIIDSGADVNIRNKFGISAIIIAAVENNIEIAKYLIGAGADLNAKTDFGKTALDIATAKGHTGLVLLFTESLKNNTGK